MWNLRFKASAPREHTHGRRMLSDNIARRERDNGKDVIVEVLFDATTDRVTRKVWTREKD